MSKRIPLSKAIRQFETFTKSYPSIYAALKTYPDLTTSDKVCTQLSSDAFRLWAAGRTLREMTSYMVSRTYWGAEDLCFIARWSSCRQVYRIDDEVFRALQTQPLDSKIPVDALLRFPYPIIYIDAALRYETFDGPVATDGCLAYIDHSVSDRDELQFIFLLKDGGRGRVWLPLVPGLTLPEAVQMIEDLDRSQNAKKGLHADPNLEKNLKAQHDDFVDCLAEAINVVLYVLSAENDPEVVYAPPMNRVRGQKAVRRTNPETITLLGGKIGRAIGEARRSGKSGDRTVAQTGRKLAPHIRIAHWQHYWVGKRKGRADGRFGDELVLKWIPPTPVNMTEGGVSETVHLSETLRNAKDCETNAVNSQL